MSQGIRLKSREVDAGLERLYEEAFLPTGAGFIADEIVVTAIMHEAWSRRTEATWLDGSPRDQDFSVTFADEEITRWIYELRRQSYVPGKGTWTSCVVRLWKSGEKSIEVFDEEVIRPEEPGEVMDRPADARTWLQDLKAFPRTVDNIPAWMWDIFRSEGVTPPVFNPELQCMEWNNRRRPVTERGTDLDVEPTVIDPSLEPGVFAKIGKKLFGG